jgi:hypothetical protein
MPLVLTVLLLVWLAGLLIAWAMCRMAVRAERQAVTTAASAAGRARRGRPAAAGR